MPRVHTAKAAKAYPEHGIEKGDTYYHWAFFRGPKQMSKTPPRQSQLCNTVLSGAYAAHEALDDAVGQATTPEEIADALDTAASDARSVVDELDEQISNLEDAFQGGCPQIDEKTEQKDSVDSFADDCDSAAQEVRDLDVSDYIDTDARRVLLREDPELSDEELDAKLDAEVAEITEFDELSDDEKQQMLEAACDLANAVSLDC